MKIPCCEFVFETLALLGELLAVTSTNRNKRSIIEMRINDVFFIRMIYLSKNNNRILKIFDNIIELYWNKLQQKDKDIL